MGMPIDWGLVGQQPNTSQGFSNAFNAGRQIGLERQSDRALQQVQTNPTDPSALTNLAVYNPQAANAFITMQNMQRAAQARDAAAGVFQASSAGGPATAFAPQNAFAPQPAPAPAPAPPAGPAPPVPGASFAQTFAPYSAPGAPQVAQQGTAAQGAPQGQPQSIQSIPPQSQPASALLQIGHPVTQAVGQAVANGMDLNSALAVYAHYANPDDLTAMISNVAKMDDVTRKRVADGNEALASAAFNLLQLPQDQRAAALDQIAPQLMQHGVSPEQIAQAKQEGLSDGLLHGAIGQAVGIDGLIKQANTVVDQGQAQQKIGIDQATLAETTRHNKMEETSGVVVQNPLGGSSLVRRNDGSVIYNSDGGGGQYTGGWTPRARNGGDNPDNVVDNKIAGAAQFLGVSPTADLRQIDPMKIAQAMTLSEGGKGSIADKNNNPANLRNPDGSYKVFPNKQAGLQAAAQLVQRKLVNGQTTVQSLVEGLPQGGTGGAQAAVHSVAQQIANYDIQPSARLLSSPRGLAIMAEVARVNPQYDAKLYQGAQKTINDFSAGKDSMAVRSLNVAVNHLDQLQEAAAALKNGNIPLFNSISNSYAQATGHAIPTNFDAIRNFVGDELTKAVTGGAGAVTDRRETWAVLNRNMSPPQLDGAIGHMKGLMAGQLAGLQRQYEAGSQRKDFGKWLSPATAAAISGHGGGSTSAVVAVNSPAEAAALPSGTLFRTPDGRTMRKR